MMKALFLSILALLPAAASAQRDTLGVLERSSVFSAEDERAVAGFHTESPAMMLYRSEQSLSQISLRIDLRREQEALLGAAQPYLQSGDIAAIRLSTRPDAIDGEVLSRLRRCGVECNLLCVVTKRLAKKAERVYKSMKATGVRYLQFIPCLDPLDTPQGQQNYSLTPELYAQFLCAMFDAWYRDWKTSTYISIRLFEDYIHLLMGSPAGTCSTTGTCGAYMVVEGSGAVYPCDFFCLDAYKLGTVQNDTLQSLLTGKKMQTFITDGWQIPAECRQCRWIRLCRGGCKRDRNATDTAQRSYYCKALQKFFAYAEPRLCEMVRAVQMYR